MRTEEADTRPPGLSLLLGGAGIVPIVAGTVGFFAAPAEWRPMIVHGDILWSSCLLCFFSGVRRGLSFRQPGRPTVQQVLGTLWLFGCGFVASSSYLGPGAALGLLAVGYLSVAVLDAVAARTAQAPRYFAYFRPWQMALPILSLLLLVGSVRQI